MLKLLDKFRKPVKTEEEDPTDGSDNEIPSEVLTAISKMKLKSNQSIMVTVSKKVVTKERQDPKSGTNELLSRDTIKTHKLTVLQTK